MIAQIKFDCSKCIEDITLDVNIMGKIMPSFSEIVKNAKGQGWQIGRDCYCLSCYETIVVHCSNCKYYEGNKSMGSSICRRDGEFAMPTDSCKQHQSLCKYINPIPNID